MSTKCARHRGRGRSLQTITQHVRRHAPECRNDRVDLVGEVYSRQLWSAVDAAVALVSVGYGCRSTVHQLIRKLSDGRKDSAGDMFALWVAERLAGPAHWP